MALQVAVDHEHLIAAWVGAGPLPDLLMVLLNVLLQEGRQEILVLPLDTSCPGDSCPRSWKEVKSNYSPVYATNSFTASL
jgi:hypothetical protein